jgi:hypothetical protein
MVLECFPGKYVGISTELVVRPRAMGIGGIFLLACDSLVDLFLLKCGCNSFSWTPLVVRRKFYGDMEKQNR